MLDGTDDELAALYRGSNRDALPIEDEDEDDDEDEYEEIVRDALT